VSTSNSKAAPGGLSFQVHTFDSSPVLHRIMLFGKSGSGKTGAAVRAQADLDTDLQEVIAGRTTMVGDESVFLLATESQGLATARLVNPKLRYALCQDIGATRAVIAAGVDGTLKGMGITRLVVDGATEIQRQIKDDILAGLADSRDRSNWFSQDDWGYLHERMRGFYHTLRMVELDVVVTALEGALVNEQTKAVHVLPGFEGRKGGESLQYFEAVGRAHRDVETGPDGAERDTYAVMFTGPSRYEVKGCGPIQGWQKPCAGAWISVLNGAMTADRTALPRRGTPRPPAPVPAANGTAGGASARARG